MDERSTPLDTPTAATPSQADTAWQELPEEVRARLRARIGVSAGAVPEGGGGVVVSPPTMSPRTRAFVLKVDRGVLAIVRHWVLAVNIIGGLYAGLPLLGPWLLSQGLTLPATLIYAIYRVTCHQLPERSFFVFGQKMCYCQRCCAIYSVVFALGLLFPLFGGRLRPLRWRWMFVLWLPMALDGFTQLFGLRESTWELRVITGALFALSCVWVAFPHLERAFGEMRRDLEARFQPRDTGGAWHAASGD